jgi:MFS family permease
MSTTALTDGTASPPAKPDRYKWTALSNTTLGMFMAMLDSSIVLISLPAIFNGIHLNPLEPANISYLLWMLMGYLVVTAVLVVFFGRMGDIFGRVRMYNLGFAVFTIGSIALSLCPWSHAAGAQWLIGWRIVQGVGGALLMANSTAILTDAFPVEERGMALGISMVAGISGSFIGLIVGGLLAEWDWRAIFWINVPFGVFGTIWAYTKLRDTGVRIKAKLDWSGNITFGVGLVLILIGITYGIQPHAGHSMGWTSPWVLAELIVGALLVALFCVIETRVVDPMFNLRLFRIRAFTMGNIAGLLSSIGRGGMQFVLIIWLQGIWLPLHGYSFEQTPLWAGIYMVPLTLGFLVSGPAAGWLSDRYGAKWFTAGGMGLAALTFVALMTLPADFSFPVFAILIFLNGIGTGLFAAPNVTGIMNSLPAAQRGAGSGMRSTFQNTGMVLSIGLFFSLMIVGLAGSLPTSMQRGLEANGVPKPAAVEVAHTPVVGSLFAAFLGYNPMEQLLGHPAADGGPSVLSKLPKAKADHITGKEFFPHLISNPFMDGLKVAFTASALMCLIAAAASVMRGGKYVHTEDDEGGSDGPGNDPPSGPFGAAATDLPGDASPEVDEWVPA